MQAGKHVVHRVEDGCALGRSPAGHRRIDEDAAFDGIHDVEHLADDRVVGAKQPGACHGHIGIGKGRDHAVFAIDLVRRGHELAWRLLAQHEVLALAGRHFGRDEEGRIGMAGVELPNVQTAAIAFEMSREIAIERSDIEAMALHDGNGIGVVRHAPNLGAATRFRQTSGPAGRNGFSERKRSAGSACRLAEFQRRKAMKPAAAATPHTPPTMASALAASRWRSSTT